MGILRQSYRETKQMDSMLGHGDAVGGTNYYTADGEVDYMIADAVND